MNSGQRRPTSHCRVCEEFFLYFDFELPSLYIHVGFVSLFVCMFDRVHCENSDKAMGKPCFNCWMIAFVLKWFVFECYSHLVKGWTRPWSSSVFVLWTIVFVFYMFLFLHWYGHMVKGWTRLWVNQFYLCFEQLWFFNSGLCFFVFCVDMATW